MSPVSRGECNGRDLSVTTRLINEKPERKTHCSIPHVQHSRTLPQWSHSTYIRTAHYSVLRWAGNDEVNCLVDAEVDRYDDVESERCCCSGRSIEIPCDSNELMKHHRVRRGIVQMD